MRMIFIFCALRARVLNGRYVPHKSADFQKSLHAHKQHWRETCLPADLPSAPQQLLHKKRKRWRGGWERGRRWEQRRARGKGGLTSCVRKRKNYAEILRCVAHKTQIVHARRRDEGWGWQEGRRDGQEHLHEKMKMEKCKQDKWRSMGFDPAKSSRTRRKSRADAERSREEDGWDEECWRHSFSFSFPFLITWFRIYYLQ